MNTPWPLPRRCLVILAALILIPALALVAIVVPWLNRLIALNAHIAQSSDQIARYRRLVDQLPTLRAELEQARADNTFAAFYFKAPTQALAGAQVQGQIQEIVRVAGGRLISTQILPPEGQEVPPRIRVRVQIQGSTDTLLAVLQRLDQAKPFLFIERLSVRSSARPMEATSPMARRPLPDQGGNLTLRLDLYGFVLEGSNP
ncbi:general secretion pathway protein GspM [Caldichromatium japonicum]|uniref:General secretion pathway protein GspM n=1 Tax=Caldichromatium japonicum TaxID=2699430 RepID=A0A6G7V9X4_9GAMM|nr:type II secretion system protein GspM [Caldichromatium japonicum]QIK36675.1 general secretion pathway protein GspM [Caldichromatium japonicum]